eukprot:Phypoly_transcript_05743.p1 GENE.Phypoly_transcript_05743~~Phypoly_transcript_05743.p1  ORF type:complete len:631 (+),score=79.08 Phypoly_transcript_05743:2-1894(+)
MKFAVGGNVVITWASEGISDTFTIVLYSQNMFVLTIASNVPNTGSYTWAAPANLSASGNYSLTISATNVNIQASSDMFTLTTDRPDTLTILTGESGHLVLAYFSDETYASGVMQSSYLFPYNGRCSTWDKQVEYQFQTYAKYSVYQSSALSALVLSFKGSDSVQDFLADGNAPFDTCNFGAQACGQVHQGFYGYYNQVRDSIFTALAQETGYFDLYVTGHSLGAALAMLAAFDISVNFNNTRMQSITLVTFGQPKVGNSDFVNIFNSRNINYTRYVDLSASGNYQDIITQSPPTLLGYQHAINATYVYCLSCSGIEITLQLHSINLYISEMQDDTDTYQVCANGCNVNVASDYIWDYSAIPSESGCTVQDNSELSLVVGTLDGDSFSVCLMTTGQIYFYEYADSKVCGGTSDAVLSPKTDKTFVYNTSIASAGSYVVVVENHNAIEYAQMYYNVSFSQGYKAPQPPLLASVLNVSADGLSVLVSWDTPLDVGTPALTYYILYWGPVGETWQSVNVSGQFTSYTLRGLQNANYYTFVVTSFNGVESDISNEGYYATPNTTKSTSTGPGSTTTNGQTTNSQSTSGQTTNGQTTAAQTTTDKATISVSITSTTLPSFMSFILPVVFVVLLYVM